MYFLGTEVSIDWQHTGWGCESGRVAGVWTVIQMFFQ